MSEHLLHFEVNGQAQEVTVQAHHLLIDLLRERLGLSGTKEACSIGVCGVCSVLVDGRVVSAASCRPSWWMAHRSRRSRAWRARTAS